jgi:hypothetical protein
MRSLQRVHLPKAPFLLHTQQRPVPSPFSISTGGLRAKSVASLLRSIVSSSLLTGAAIMAPSSVAKALCWYLFVSTISRGIVAGGSRKRPRVLLSEAFPPRCAAVRPTGRSQQSLSRQPRLPGTPSLLQEASPVSCTPPRRPTEVRLALPATRLGRSRRLGSASTVSRAEARR